MEKLDAKFYGEIRKVKDNSIVPDDEWCVFLVKDDAFARLLPIYRTICTDLGADAEQIAAVDRMIARANRWRSANPHRLKVPDAQGERLLDNDSAAPLVPRRRETNEHTSPEVLIIASKVMRGDFVSPEDLKRLAASALTQAKDRDHPGTGYREGGGGES
jgi:hypothetical protein